MSKFYNYEMYKRLKKYDDHYEWLKKMFYEIIELDSIKQFTKHIEAGICINDKLRTYINGNIQYVESKNKKIIIREFLRIDINLKSHTEFRHNLSYLIDTIAHEISHQIHINHTKKHTETTKTMKKIITEELKLKKAHETIKQNTEKNKLKFVAKSVLKS